MKLNVNNSPYVLDTVDIGENHITALTRKNADFIEAVVRLDSNYSKDLVINPPDKSFDPYKDISGSSHYCGSTAYWFNEMTKENSKFDRCLLGAIIAIDRTNSTHLEATVNGRQVMKDRICSCCKNVHDLISMLNTPFNYNNNNHLITLLTDKAPAVKGGYRYNISFATKFCAYASIFLEGDIQYSKYDNVVSDALPLYAEAYLSVKVKKLEYKINDYEARNIDDQEKLKYRLKKYSMYADCINSIIIDLKKSNICISVEEFDHIVWYANKG